ncbi:Pca regulon regulatory protein [Gammaproteobacteria bacterium]|nr:helix-turn-helix domain-containing protein [Gammaproteobacteria bacterium]QOJ30921.1 MAG: helix-turn-helix domain-containing protein [Gammaproteobacteria bacterium]CAG0944440.1 Pca regulon regulatory protein [Gammaproteobacteria bacterium]
MSPQANISKSVSRGFRVLELFRERRQPMTAAQIQHALRLPQPSVRVLLGELVDIGYLAYTMPAKTYFPTAKVCQLGDWLGTTILLPDPLLALVDSLARELEETCTLSTATQGHVQVLYVCRATHGLAMQVAAGMGGALWRSTAGRTLLATLDDGQLDAYFDHLDPRGGPRSRRQREQIMEQVRRIRSQGVFAGYDVLLKGVGAVSLPVPTQAAGMSLVLTVSGGKDRIQPREKPIIRIMRQRLREALHGLARPPGG